MRCDAIRFGTADESRVHSIYFDDDQLSSCEESLAGISRRTKLRLRWYDADLSTGPAWFEVKRREGTMVRKLRTPLRLPAPMSEMGYGALMAALHAAMPEAHAAALALRSRPTMLVSYRRRHFRDPSTGMRLTLDHDISGMDQRSAVAPTRRFAVPIPDLVLVEAKVKPGDEPALRRLLAPMQPRPTRSSKYLTCCAHMGWCSLSDRHE